MLKNLRATIISNEKTAEGIYRVVLHCPGIDLKHLIPGQFAHIGIPGRRELLMKRPISINDFDEAAETLTLIYQMKGQGTSALVAAEPGAEMDVIAPVGRGYHLTAADRKVFLIGGGVGIAPLPTIMKRWPDKQYEAFLGYRGLPFAYCQNEFGACDIVHVASDDGTIGELGVVTALLEKRLADYQPDILLACGPPPMLRALKKVVDTFGLRCQVSMEQRMCCGFGACATCVCGVHTPDGLDYKKVCVEGPVFDIQEVNL
jgi:dihydroorotate dehydrogenase electron transfer subunit